MPGRWNILNRSVITIESRDKAFTMFFLIFKLFLCPSQAFLPPEAPALQNVRK